MASLSAGCDGFVATTHCGKKDGCRNLCATTQSVLTTPVCAVHLFHLCIAMRRKLMFGVITVISSSARQTAEQQTHVVTSASPCGRQRNRNAKAFQQNGSFGWKSSNGNPCAREISLEVSHNLETAKAPRRLPPTLCVRGRIRLRRCWRNPNSHQSSVI